MPTPERYTFDQDPVKEVNELFYEQYVQLIDIAVAGIIKNRILGPNIEIDSLKTAGYLGLVDAKQKYKPGLGLDFRGYALIRINGSIMDFLRKESPIPRSFRDKLKALRSAAEELSKGGKEVNRITLANHLGKSPEEIDQMQLEAGLEFLTIANTESEDPNKYSMFMDDIGLVEPTQESTLVFESRIKEILDAIYSLQENLSRTMILYYFEDLNMKEIASVLGVTESRVSQYHTAAIKKIKELLKK